MPLIKDPFADAPQESAPLENITEQDYIDAAQKIGCEVNVIKAVASVESGGSGFFKDGELAILFEPHVFWRQLVKQGVDPNQILHQHPDAVDILYKKWKTYPYPPASKRWSQIHRAAEIQPEAAYESASYGMFQIMGFHFRVCGYKDAFSFVNDLKRGTRYHLKAFVSFIISNGLVIHLKKKNWEAIAEIYNGSGYKDNKYDSRLKEDYDKLCQQQQYPKQ